MPQFNKRYESVRRMRNGRLLGPRQRTANSRGGRTDALNGIVQGENV